MNTCDITFHRSSTKEINHEEWLFGVLAGVKSTIMTRFGEEEGKITALQDLAAQERTTTCAAKLQVEELRKKLEEERVTKEDNKVAMAALQQEFYGKLAQEIVVRERLSEELANATGQLVAAASACHHDHNNGRHHQVAVTVLPRPVGLFKFNNFRPLEGLLLVIGVEPEPSYSSLTHKA
jgi:hypothetical protein